MPPSIVRSPPARRAPMPALIVAFVGLSLAGFFSLYHAGFCDFRAFYCAGRVVLSGHDAYREHPLHECERALPSRFAPTLPAAVTLPAPFPPSTLALFAGVARLPFGWALAAWTVASCLVLGTAIVLAARLAAVPVWAAAIVLGYPAVIVALPLGQLTLFIMLAIVSCATLLRADRPRCAALAALTTLVDPHVGLAVCAGVAAGVPNARAVLAGGAAAIVAATTLAVGIGPQWEYVHDVLPAHALANLPDFSQYSTANFAFIAGASPRVALLAGECWYGVSLVAGVLAGRRLRSRLGSAAVALVPVAFAVFGGVHTHLQQLALAMPAFLLILGSCHGHRRRVVASCAFIAAMPWLLIAPFPYVYLATALLGIAFARSLGDLPLGAMLGVASMLVLAGLLAVVLRTHETVTAFAPVTTGNPLAQEVWGAFVRASFVPAEAWFVLAKLPTLAAFFVLLAMLLGIGDRRRAPALSVPDITAHPV